MQKLSRPLVNAAGVLFLLAATWLLYAPGLSGSFIFDDYPNLVLNDHWKVSELEWKQWLRAISQGESTLFGRPLALLSFAANHFASGMDPWAMKATNIGIHGFNACLILLLTRHVLRGAVEMPPLVATRVAWLLAVIWAIHPMQVSTVLYVVQRMEMGALSFTLLSLIAYCLGRRAQIQGGKSAPWLTLSAIAMLLGLGFKETAALTPIYALLLEFFVYRFKGAGGATSRALIAIYLGASVIGLALYFIFLMPIFLRLDAWEIRSFEAHERVLAQGPILWLYISQVLWPDPSRMPFFYDNLRFSEGILTPSMIVLSWAGIAILLLLLYLKRKSTPLAALGVLLFFSAHGITSNILPLELAFEHRNYFALYGILLAVTTLAHQGMSRYGTQNTKLAAGFAVVTLSFLTFLQADLWGNRLDLGIAHAGRNPESTRASYGLAVELQLGSRGDPANPMWSMALEQMRATAKIEHGAPLGEQGEIVMLSQAGRAAPKHLWNSLREKLLRRKAGADERAVLQALVKCSLAESCMLDDLELQRTFTQILEINSESADIHSQYANFAFNRMRDPALAIALLERAIELEPDALELQIVLLEYRLAMGELEPRDAQREFELIRQKDRYGRLDGFRIKLRRIPPIRQTHSTGPARDADS